MKIRKLFLASVASWLLFSAQAEAAPVAVAITAIAGKLAAGGFAAMLIKGAVGLALQAGMSLYQKAKQKKALEKQQARGINVSVRTGDDNSIEIPIGKSVTPGIRAYAGTWGQDGKTPNAYFTDVLELSYLPVPGLAGMWAGDKKCTVLWDQPHASGLGCPVQEYRAGGKDFMWVKFVDGSQAVADPFLRSTFGGHATRPFKDTMVGRGVAYVIVTTRFNQNLFAAGKPEYLFEPSPPVFYDIRKDSTAGGNGPHRWGERSTWEPSENNAVIIYCLVRGIYFGNEWVFGGQNLAAFRLPASNWMAAANECDRLIAKKDGTTEKQFRCGYQIHGDMEPLEVIEELRKGCNGQLAECGGVFKLLVGAPGAAVYSFTDDHVVVKTEQELDPFPAPDEIHNGIEATYPEPAERWVMKDAPPRYDAALEAADNGHRRATSIPFPASPHALMVQRLMEAMLKDGRRFAIHVLSLPPETKPLEPNDVVSWSSARNGYTNKKFQIMRKTGAAGFRQIVTLKEIDPSDHGWTTDMEAPTSIGHVGPTPVPPQPMYGWTVEPYEVKDSLGVSRRPSIKVSCAPDQDDVKNVLVEVRLKSSQEVIFQSDATAYAAPHSWVLPGTFLPNTLYEVRGKYVPYSNRQTEFSNWLPVTTPNILISSNDINDNAIVREKIADAAIAASKLMDEAVTNIKLAADAVSTAKIQVGAIDTLRLADNSVQAAKIASAAVTGAKIADGAVTGTKIVDLAITETKIANDAISTPKLQALAITADKLSANAVVAGKIAANAVMATNLAADSVTARSLVLTDFSNIADNGWQTGTLDGWSTSYMEEFTLAPANGDQAGWRMRSIGRDQAISNPIACTPGEPYYMEAWVYNADPATANLYMFTWDAAGTGGFAAAPIATTNLKNQWVKLQGIATVPAGKGRIALCLQTERVAGTGAATYWTKPVMRRASTAELIVDGAIYAKHLSVGSGKNLLANTEFWGGSQDWVTWVQNGVANRSADLLPADDPWALDGQPYTARMTQSDANQDTGIVEWMGTNPSSGVYIPVKPNQRYEAYAYVGAHRCSAYTCVIWYDANRNYLLEQHSPLAAGSVGGNLLSGYQQIGLFPVAPANAAFAAFSVRKNKTVAGEVNSYVFMVRPYFGEAYPNQTQFSPWSPGGFTTVGADYIRTGAVIAGKIAASAVTAATIAAGAVTAEKIAASAVTADKIAANSVTALHIVANSITASKLVLTDFSNIVDNGWQRGTLEAWWTQNQADFYYGTNDGDAAGYILRSLGRDCATSQRIACSPGEAYFFDVWVYNTDARRANILALVTDGNTANHVWLGVVGTDTKNAWVRLQGRTVVPAGKAFIQMILQNDRPAGTGTSTFWSKPVMRRATNAELIVDGSIRTQHIAAYSITADKLSVTTLSAITSNFGDTYHSGISRSADGRMVLNWSAGYQSFSDNT